MMGKQARSFLQNVPLYKNLHSINNFFHIIIPCHMRLGQTVVVSNNNKTCPQSIFEI